MSSSGCDVFQDNEAFWKEFNDVELIILNLAINVGLGLVNLSLSYYSSSSL